VELGDLVLFVKPHDDVERGCIALNGVQRKLLRVSTGMVTEIYSSTNSSTISYEYLGLSRVFYPAGT